MKHFKILLVALFCLIPCLGVSGEPDPKPLYLHCIGPDPAGNGKTIHLMTTRVNLGQPIDLAFSQPSQVTSLRGKVDFKKSVYLMKIHGDMKGTAGEYEGEAKLDQRYSPQMFLGSNVYYFFAFVLSHSKDHAAIIKGPFFMDGEQ